MAWQTRGNITPLVPSEDFMGATKNLE